MIVILRMVHSALGEDAVLPLKTTPIREMTAFEEVIQPMSNKAVITAVTNQKGGTGKTTTCENLGIGLAMEGKKVLLVDCDPQASLTIALGNPRPDDLPVALSDLMAKVISDQPISPGEGILHHPEGVDLVPANIALAGTEVSLVTAMSRETILKQYLDTVRKDYDFILLDCMPSLGMLTVNALAAAEQALIPVQANYLSAKGLEQLLNTINKVRRQINPKLRIEGILLTMVDSRTKDAKEISQLIPRAQSGLLKSARQDKAYLPMTLTEKWPMLTEHSRRR